MLGLISNDVDHVVDRDTTNNAIVVVDYRRRQQVPVLEFPHDLSRGCMCRDRHDVRRHDARHECIRVVGQKPRQEKRANVFIIAIDDEDQVCPIGHLAYRSQVTGDDFQRNVGTDSDDVDIHQPAGTVLIVSENLLQAFVIEFVE